MGMVCIRNMHAKDEGGRFVGRWSYGHPGTTDMILVNLMMMMMMMMI